jgi:hypothetical protein
MTPLVIGGIIEAVGKIAGDLITTDKERMEAELEARKLTLEGIRIEAGLIAGQQQINQVEAANPSRFVAGWRPAAGWVCAISLAMVYIPKATVMTSIWTYQAIVIVSQWTGQGVPPAIPEFPDLGVTDLIGLLMSMLGLGAMRSWDKGKSVDTKAVS